MRITEILFEGVAGPKNCWPGHRKVGTKPGTGKNAGKRVNDCKKIGEDAEVEESGLQYYTGVKKHGKEYMKRAAKAGREGASQEELGRLKDRYSKAEKDKSQKEDLDQEFDMIESIIESIADQHAIDPELVWEDLTELSDDELYVFAVTSELINEDWQKANKRDKTDGMSKKAAKLKTAVTTKPSKLKKGSKASKRRKSYCSRSRGQMKMHSISCAKTPDKAICKARRRWNC